MLCIVKLIACGIVMIMQMCLLQTAGKRQRATALLQTQKEVAVFLQQCRAVKILISHKVAALRRLNLSPLQLHNYHNYKATKELTAARHKVRQTLLITQKYLKCVLYYGGL